jgi:opacity protein-like surface antigen
MKTFVLSIVAASALASSALAADLKPVLKAKPAAPPPAWWEIAYGGALMSDYNFRGISQSDRGMAGTFYFEGRLNPIPDVLQFYAGAQAWTTKLPTTPVGEFDLYGGMRVTTGPLQFDLGTMYYYYPRETQVFLDPLTAGLGNVLIPGAIPFTKADTDFLEFYAKATWTVNPMLALGAYVYYTRNWLNTGAPGTYYGGTAKFTAPTTWFPADWGAYASGEFAHYNLGTTDAFFGFIDLPDYNYWNAGVGITFKVFTLDFRYHDTNLDRTQCFVLTGDLHGLPGGGGPVARSNWCSRAFIVKASVDTSAK